MCVGVVCIIANDDDDVDDDDLCNHISLATNARHLRAEKRRDTNANTHTYEADTVIYSACCILSVFIIIRVRCVVLSHILVVCMPIA